MSFLHLVRCEICDKTAQGVTSPDDWYTLSKGDETWHFHDEACLAIWRLTKLSVMPAQPEPQEQLPCKARRFLLYDGETADITEGVQWENGHVSLADSGTFCSWERMKEGRDGSGIQWIDQEVAE